MSIFTVDTTSDVVDAYDGVLSLREALAQADRTDEADTIQFSEAVQGGTIVLAGSQLTVASDVTINGGSGVTIDADQKSRVLLVQDGGEFHDPIGVTLAHLTITGGRTLADGEVGGGIWGEGYTSLTLDHATVSGNSTVGTYAAGGGIFSYRVYLTSSTVTGNSTTGENARGGGISGLLAVWLTDSTVSGNSTVGENAYGGGTSGGSVFLTSSTVSGNSTTGENAHGGGISGGFVGLTDSTVSGNDTAGESAYGGGISSRQVFLTSSTVSGNSAAGENAHGGGIGSRYGTTLAPENSIIAGNSATSAPDLFGVIASYGGAFSNGHNIFGSDVEGNVAGDLENVAPSLLFAALDPTTGGGQLGDNGGPTQTIALRDAADNPALGGADPEDAPATDQRGVARPQPAGTDPDIGAFELDQAGGGLNEIVGTDRGEFLSGTRTADLIRGLGGNDRLWGRPGDDLLYGDAGRDVLAGKAGIDRMTGGADADRFLFRRPTDAPDGPAHDEILDFSRAEHDRIDLRPIDARSGMSGSQAFDFVGRQAFTGAGQLRYEAMGEGDFLVSGNTDSDHDAEFAFVVRTGLANLKEADFLL